jgi:hypothetical protein
MPEGKSESVNPRKATSRRSRESPVFASRRLEGGGGAFVQHGGGEWGRKNNRML